jgi:hypothetical protein
VTARCGAGARAIRNSATTGCFTSSAEGPGPKRIPLATLEQVLRLYQEKYFDLNVRHFHEKLREVEGAS